VAFIAGTVVTAIFEVTGDIGVVVATSVAVDAWEVVTIADDDTGTVDVASGVVVTT